MESSVFRVTMGPYGISNNERHVHTIDGHTKCCREVCFEMENQRYRKRTINNVVQLARLLTYRQGAISEWYKTLGKWLVWVNRMHSFVSIFHHAWHWEVSPLLIHGM